MRHASSFHPLFLLASTLASAALLSGCNLTDANYSAAPAPGYQLGTITGVVHGGAPPVIGATVKMYATQNNGYGGAGLLLAEANSTDGTQGDGVDTDINGNFTFSTANYVAACPAGQQVYITASGGSSYSGSNGSGPQPNLLLMAALGSCDSLYNVSGSGKVYQGPTVWVDEVTTTAAAYALANFITISGTAAPYTVNISAPVANNYSDGVNAWNGSAYAACSNTACNGYASFNYTTGVETTYANGLAHAFTNAVNLVNLSNGTANTYIASGAGTTTKPSSGGYGIIPAAVINTVANALQTCVNSLGTGSYVAPVSTQAPTATQPEIDTITFSSTSDTAYGVLKISAGTSGAPVTTSLKVGGGTTFSALATQINNSAVGSYVTASATGAVVKITANNNGTAYALSYSGTSLLDVYPSTDTSTACGKLFNYTPPLAPSTTLPTNTLQAAINLAKNPYSNASNVANIQALPTAVTSVYSPNLTSAPPDWSLSIVYTGGGLANPYNLALDANDNVYTNNTNTNVLVALSNSGNFIYGTSGVAAVNSAGSAITTMRGLAADSNGYIYVPDDVAGNTSTSLAGTYQFTASTGAYNANLTHANGSPSTSTDPITNPLEVAVTRRNDVWTSYGALGAGNIDWWQCAGTTTCSYAPASTTGNVNTYSDGAFTEITTTNINWGIAVDAYQNVWTAVQGSSTTPGTEIAILVNNYGASPATYPAYDNSTTAGSAAPFTNKKLAETIPSYCGTAPYTIAFDGSGNGWFTTTTTPPSSASATTSGYLCELTPGNGGVVPTSATFGAAGISLGAGMPEALAIDGNNVAWVPLFSYNNSSTGYANYGVAAYSTTLGALQSEPVNGYTSCFVVVSGNTVKCGTGSTTAAVDTNLAISNPRQAAIDSSGNLWLNEPDDSTVTVTLGIAAPTWPLLAAAKFGVEPQ
jgi:hypothetical protein